MLKINVFFKKKNIDCHSKEISLKNFESVQNKSVPTEKKVISLLIYKVEEGSKLNSKVDGLSINLIG